jgi:hypothetical protein
VPGLRPSGPPPDVRAVPAVGERVIAWGRDSEGSPIVVTRLALYLPTSYGFARRLPFEQVATATWDDPVLAVHTVGPARGNMAVRLTRPGKVPEAVRERVTASIVVSEHVALGPGAGAQITARRDGTGDQLTWNVIFDVGLDASDTALRQAADDAIARIRQTTGL